ncbi:hypothetical protein [Brachyspira sp.]|uniref:hypothetical protein n=1 Tax=Brachyspira sp. TaxID=1977261 RepID=UPI00262D9731|nr:hypothetical protein [Brachyspira sp.]
MFKFIYSKRDEDIYRIRTIFGIKIITKPLELRLIHKLNNIEDKITNIEEYTFTNYFSKELYKLESYKLFANNKQIKANKYENTI